MLRSQIISEEKKFTNNLNGIVNITTRVSRGNVLRSVLKKILQNDVGQERIEWAEQNVFFRQHMHALNCADALDEFVLLGKNTNKYLYRFQIDILASIGMKEENWYQVIRYCTHCLNHLSDPTLVLVPPRENSYLDLFIISSDYTTSLQSNKLNSWLINRIISMQLAFWLSKPFSINVPCRIDEPIDLNTRYYIDKAIYNGLVISRLESIHSFTKWLYKNYDIELSHQMQLNNVHKIRFRRSNMPWLNEADLIFDADDIRRWLDFNRIFKDNLLSDRVRKNYFNTSA